MVDFDREERKRISMMRTITNYGMGVFFVAAGIFFLFHYQLGFGDEEGKLSVLDIIIGVMFLLYGAWRIYRGYKKDYFK